MRPSPSANWIVTALTVVSVRALYAGDTAGLRPAQAGDMSSDQRGRAASCDAAVLYASAAAVAGLAIADMATASASARRYNQRHLAVGPYADRGTRSYGLSISWAYGKARPARRKSPGTASALSVSASLVPILATAVPALAGVDEGKGGPAVFLAGVVIGPSVGHFYAEQTGRGVLTTALRGVGAYVGTAWLVNCIGS